MQRLAEAGLFILEGKKKAVGIYLLLVFGNREDALGGEVKGFIFM